MDGERSSDRTIQRWRDYLSALVRVQVDPRLCAKLDLRRLSAAKVDARRERSLQVALDDSSARLEKWLIAEQSSPSQEAQRQEQALA